MKRTLWEAVEEERKRAERQLDKSMDELLRKYTEAMQKRYDDIGKPRKKYILGDTL